VWWKAEATTEYWAALAKFTDGVERAKRYDVEEARPYKESSYEARHAIGDAYRAAFGQQLLTPASDMEKMNWKRQQLRKGWIGDLKKELVEKAIAKDIAWLDAHPTGQTLANKARKGNSR
jgi:hypothetical protein